MVPIGHGGFGDDTAFAEAVVDIASGPLKRDLLISVKSRSGVGTPLRDGLHCIMCLNASSWSVAQRWLSTFRP